MSKKIILRNIVRMLPAELQLAIKRKHYARLLKTFPEDQELDLKIVRTLVHENDYVVDIGANIGVYTKFLSRWVGNSGLVYSIEPMPSTYQVLTANIKQFHMNNVRHFNIAVSDADKMVMMEMPLDESGLENHYLAQIVQGGISKSNLLSIQAKSVDSILSELHADVAFIKIDTEGHELFCVRGAMKTISKSQPALLIEISSPLNDKASEGFQLLNLLKDKGYSIWCFDGETMHRRQIKDTRANSFFLMPKHIKLIKEYGIPVLDDHAGVTT